jgi:hypothetical protein
MAMATEKQSDLSACWGLFWRCFVFMPVMLGLFIVVGGIWILRWILPLRAAIQTYNGDYWATGATLVIWSLCFWTYRRFRLLRFFENPPSLL